MKMHTKLLIRLTVCIIFLCANWVFSQEFSVSGKVIDVDKQPISFANVLLLRQIDSSFVAGTSTDDKGLFEFRNISKEQYLINISFIGFKTTSLTVDLIENITLDEIVLQEDAEALSEVNITYKRPTVQKLPDRLTFNIANSPLVEGNILQVLKSTPGVLVMDGNIMVKSSSPTVYINNRKVQLTNRELSQLLENSSANSVKSIEVITNPSARYDADSGVVLNIVMAKNLVTGYRGDVFNNFTQGVFPRYNFGTGHFFKTDKININLNYSYTGNKIDRRNDDFVNFLDADNTIEEQWRSLIDRTTWSENHNINLNFDYYLTEKTTLSLTSTASVMPYFKYKINNNTSIRDNVNNFLGGFTANNLSRDDRFNIGTDLDLKHNFENDAQLTINAHYTNYDYSRNQNVFSEFFDANNDFERASEFRTLANQNTKIISSQIDYELPLSETASFETGVKFSNVQTNSDLAQFDRDLSSGDETLNTQNSDDFDYDEKVYAAYANYSKSWENWSLNLGLRVEQTNIEGISDFGNTTNTQDYFEWFPNYSIQYDASENFSIYTNYKRSLQRPSYTNLNPFRFFLNENYEVTGNPNLQPAFKNHFVVGANLFNLFTVEAYYIRYDGNIVELPRQDNTTNIISFVPVNLDETVDFGFDFLTYFNVTDRWSIYFVNSIFNMRESTNFGDGFVDINQWTNYTVLSNDFTFLKDDSLSVNFAVSLITTDLQGLRLVEERLFSSLSFSKTLFKKKAILSLTFEDLFNYQNEFTTTQYLNQFNRVNTITDSRTVTLGFRYKFGNTGLQTNERGLSKDERDRIKDFN
jgi:hypothetical protein